VHPGAIFRRAIVVIPEVTLMRTRRMLVGLVGVAALALLGIIGAGISRVFPPAPNLVQRALPPQTSFPPAIKGAPVVGKALHAGKGLWKQRPTGFAYQWMRCDAKGNDCSKITGGTEATYVLRTADLGHTILVFVTASNSKGSETANSHPTDVVTKAPPGPSP
jgi:hypothetical protein